MSNSRGVKSDDDDTSSKRILPHIFPDLDPAAWMEALLLFCCRSCLKGGDEADKEYYDLLGIENYHCSSDEIKKSYKKKSLQLHPDRLAQKGIQVTAEHNQKFQQLKEAYDVLSDPRKRRLYDKIGKSGLKLIDSPQEVNPKELIKNFQQNKKDRNKLMLVIGFIFASILILPILFCLKCDGRLDGLPWLAMWTPMWVINAVMVISAILFLMEKDPDHPTDETGGPEEEINSEDKSEKVPLSVKLLFAIKTFSFVLLQIFIFARLDEHLSSWSWYQLFLPWFIYEASGLVEKITGGMFSLIPQPDLTTLEAMTEQLTEEEKNIQKLMLETEYFRKVLEQLMMRKSCGVAVMRVWLAIFLAAQLDDRVDWDWGLVLLPIWVYFLLEILFGYRLRQWGASYLQGIDFEAAERGELDPMTVLKAQHGQVTTTLPCSHSELPFFSSRC
jgi:curved DNA-binding protein CbpA